MELRECTEEYWEFVRELRNDNRVQSGFIEQVEITADMQRDYMAKYSSCYRIALVGQQPAGYVGVVNDDIRVCTHPDFQGRGVGKFMIDEIMKIFPTAQAKIKIDNDASLNLFDSCGFVKKYYILTKE